ncbi:MAG: branched-chain amino acid ABC transporter substrate-binding protein [Bacteroidetes bacterium]|nr:branched-chain amino acid ABC transporter substrate-binding protein [Bacteroidota bacterium]
MKKTVLIILAVLLSCSLLFAQGAEETGTIKIGVAGAHSGDLASYGLPSVNAVKLVVANVNAAGGIDGKMIEVFVEDDQCKPEIATNTAAKLVGENVVAVIGHICSGATKAALDIYNESKIVVISPSATNPPLTQSGDYPNFLRTIAPDDAQARLQVDFAINILGAKKIAVLHDKGDYGKGLAEFAQTFIGETSVEVVLFEGVTPGAVDYSAVINKIAQTGADTIIYGGYHPEAAQLIGQMRDQGLEIDFIGGDGVMDATFVAVAGEDAEGVYATSVVDTSSNPVAIKAGEEHLAEYGEEYGAFFLNAYAAALAIVNAIDVANSTDYDAIMAALKSEYVETSVGNISFDERGDAIGVGFAMYQVNNGKFAQLD